MKFLRIRRVMQLTGLSRMTIYRLELAGEFLSGGNSRRTRWPGSTLTSLSGAELRPVSQLRGRPGSSSGPGGAAYG